MTLPDGTVIENVPEGTTQEEVLAKLKQNNISIRLDPIEVTPADGLSDVTVEETVTTEPKREPTAMESIKDVFTGELRQTPETESLPDWMSMPDFEGLTNLPAWKTALGIMLTNPEETAGIIKANFPEMEIRRDSKGNFIYKSLVNGKDYIYTPGITAGDIPRIASGVAAFSPAGGAKTILGQSLGSAATQGAIEGIEGATGGEVSGTNIGLAGALPAALGGISKLSTKIMDRLKGTPSPLNMAEQAPQPPQMAEQVAPTEEGLRELASTAKSAGMGSKSATEELASQVAPNPETVEAAKRLGIDQYLQPDHVTTNQMYRELAQAVKSKPFSQARAAEIEGLLQVTKRADDIIADLGASDVSVINDMAKRELQAAHDKTFKEAGKLYEEVRQSIPATTPVTANNVLDVIATRAEELGGEKFLSSSEKMILSKLAPQDGKLPTYALLDDVRRDITAAKYKNQGAFKDADSRLLDIVNNELRKDQKLAADQFGMGDTFELAQKTAGTYKGMQDDITALFGKTMSDSIVGDISSSTSALAKGDTSKFIKLLGSIKYLPKDQQQQIVASGLNTAFGKELRNGTMNFGSYAQWYKGLEKNKQAYTALMSNLPKETVTQLKDLYTVSDNIAKAMGERITTGRINIVEDVIKNADTLTGKLYEATKQSGGKMALGAMADVVGTGGAGMAFALGSALQRNKTPAMEAVDKLITSKEFAKVATDPSRENIKRLAYDKRFTNFMKSINNDMPMSEREQWILNSIQATKPKE